MKTISRRTVLRGLGGAAIIPLPFLDIMARPRMASAESAISKTGANGAPKRFLVLFTPCGQGFDWNKNTNGPDGKLLLPTSLAPLEKIKDDLIFVNGLDNKSAIFGDTSGIDAGHGKPFLNLMTCVPNKNNLGGGISIDQAIAKEVKGDTKFPSLQLASNPQGSGNITQLSLSGPGVGLPALSDPQKVFAKLFTDFKADPAVMLKVQAERKSVLDGIKAEYADFAKTMSGDDLVKVNAHLDGIREVEKRLSTSSSAGGAACTVPARPVAAADYVATGNAQMDLVALAFACDLTRVVTMLWQGSGGNVRLPTLGRGIHDASHDFSAAGDADRNKATAYHAMYFAAILTKFKNITEPAGGSLLDNMIVYWCSEHGCGNHNYDMMPIMLAGGAGGYWKTGRAVTYPNGSRDKGHGFCNTGNCPGASGPGHGELYTSFLNAMGVPATSFGDPRYCRGPLPAPL